MGNSLGASEAKALGAVLLTAVALGFAPVSRAQGCSQCRDTVSQTNPAQQGSYRTAIGIMLAGALTVGGAGVLAMRRFGR